MGGLLTNHSSPACFYANDASVKGWQVKINVEYFADDESLTVDSGRSPVQMGNAPLASPTIRYIVEMKCL